MPACVTIILPAFNAAETLKATVQTVLSQSMTDWEMVILDGGSTDETSSVAKTLVDWDPRIRLVRQRNGGAAAARDRGLLEAHTEWVVFLDSDDLLAPNYLKQMTLPLGKGEIDAVICSSAILENDGRSHFSWAPPLREEFFARAVKKSPIAIHAAVVRRSLIEALGGWDTTLATCEDWDLWQRVARSKARIEIVPETLAFIKRNPDSLSRHPNQVRALAKDGLEVIARSGRSDSRVMDPDPRWADGCSCEDFSRAITSHLIWVAGVDLGNGGDGRFALERLRRVDMAAIDSYHLADTFRAAFYFVGSRETGRGLTYLSKVKKFLAQLEMVLGFDASKNTTLTFLETILFDYLPIPQPVLLGSTLWQAVEVSEPIRAVSCLPGTQLLIVQVIRGGKWIGRVSLPNPDRVVPADQIAVAIAEQHFVARLAPQMWCKRWPGPRLWTTVFRLALQTKTLKFAADLISLNPQSRRDRFTALNCKYGPMIVLGSGVLRTERWHLA